MMKKNFRKNLQTAVLLSCTILFPWQAMAEEDFSEYIYNFTYDGKTYFDAIVLSPGQETELGVTRRFEEYEKKSFQEQALVYLGDITGKPKGVAPMILLVPTDIKDFNASAYSDIDIHTANTYYGNYFIGGGVNSSKREPIASIVINSAMEGYNWYADEYPILPLNGMDSDYPGTVVHEMVHAMGVGAYNIGSYNNGDAFYVEYDMKFTDGLYDVFGRNLKDLSNGKDKLPAESISIAEYNTLKDGQVPNDKFYVINYDDAGRYGGVYFSGTNVDAVLGNDTKLAWPDGLGFDPVPGIPINCYEDDYLELSHLELQNSLMSHQSYRNWCTLMEAELAVLQDLGYDVDRGKFFGQSIYASGEISKNVVAINDFANSAEKSWTSDTDRAIGLHIYGSNNKVTLGSTANITANGSYSMGVRVDGADNNLTISSNVKVGNEDSDRHNYGISVNYGKGHNVTIESGASVVAKGEKSVGAIFDFGSNELGDEAQYRGSYIRGKIPDDSNNFINEPEYITSGVKLTENGALAGALVDAFNVNGTLHGEKAIYISPNALVREINIAGNDTNNTFEVKGDIISEWNPEVVEYFYTRDYCGENPYKGLKPNLPSNDLNEYRTNLNFNGDRTFIDNIIGPYGLIMNVKSGNLTTANGSGEDSSYINVQTVNVGDDNSNSTGATYTVNNVLMAEYGYGTINVMDNGKLEVAGDEGAILIAFNDEDGNGKATSGRINNFGTVDFSKGSLALKPEGVYYDVNTEVQVLVYANDDGSIDDGEKFGGIWFVDMNGEKAELAESNSNSRALSANNAYKITKTLTMSAEQVLADSINTVLVTTERSFDDVDLGDNEAAVGQAMENVDGNINSLADERGEDWKNMLSAIDFMKTDGEINNALGQLSPSSYGYGAMATMDLHRMLSDFAVGGSLAPATNVKEKGKWHNIVIPYASETDHIKNGSGYKNNHSGVVGAMERTLGDVSVGWHAALNHQSTTGAETGRLKGDGLYLGAQVKYAPASWNGWSAFGIARVGVEDFEMNRKFNFNGYTGKVDSDFTAFSGNVRVGGAYEKEAKAMTFGPFAALDYAFAHHPSIDEEGSSAGRLSLDSGTYDSLRTQLGYRIQTAPKLLEERTYWQANAAIAWNHELLDDAGCVSATFRDFGGSSFGCDVDNYGRDSLSLMAGMTFKNPSKLDVTFNLGTDIYRHGGNTLYAKCALEWKF